MSAANEAPLSGIRVLDLTRLIPGPLATWLLGRMGAEIIKVEDPKVGDYLRTMLTGPEGKNATYHMLNEGKRHMVLDLKQDAGKEVLHRLLKNTDILVEQFRPGVLARLGFAPEELRQKYPQLIIASITGFGQTGPWAHKAGHDINYLALSGLLSRSFEKESTSVVPPFQAADIAGGSYYPVVAIMGALLSRQKSGQGAHLDISMTEGVIPLALSNTAPALGGNDLSRPEYTVLQGGCAAYGVYECRDKTFISIAPIEPKFWLKFCAAVDRPQWATWHLQAQRFDELKAGLVELFAAKSAVEWAALLAVHDCCVEAVLNSNELSSHPQHEARGVFTEGPALRLPAIEALGADQKPSTQNMQAGSDTRAIMEELGYNLDQINTMNEQRLIRCG